MALNILIADSDRQWLGETKKQLIDATYSVYNVENGKEVQLEIYNSKDDFFAVIINFSIENFPITQVLKFIKNNTLDLTTIVVVNEDVPEEEYNIETLKKLGVTEVIFKKDGYGAISEILEGHLSLGDVVKNLKTKDGVSEEVQVSGEDAKFTQIKLNEFMAGKNVLFDVFVKLSSGKYVKILHAGDSFNKERINKYKEKKVEYLHFSINDRKEYIQYQAHISKKMVENKNAPTILKSQLLKNATEKYVEEVFARGVKPLVIQQGKEICSVIYEMINNEKNLAQLLKEYHEFDPNAYSHTYCVTLFATSIIKQFDWQSKGTIETTSLACLFHDIGKIKLAEGLIDLAPSKLTDEQRISYEKHPEYGVEMVDGNHLISNSVKQIILQHHENYNGTGFPKGIKGNKILTLSNIVHLADDFVRLVEEKECRPVEALKILLQDQEKIRHYNSMIVESFIKVFVDPGAIKNKQGLIRGKAVKSS